SDWQAYGDLKKDNFHIRPKATDITDTDAESLCSECGNSFSQEEMIRYGNSYVCADCKPAFVQKLKEGILPEDILKYAGFRIRSCAKFLDGFIITGGTVLLAAVFGIISSSGSGGSYVFQKILPYMQPVSMVIVIIYETWFVGRFGATPGKMICRIKVVTADGGRVSYLRAFGRYFATFLSGIILCIGYIMAAFDGQKRALHDRICSTRVIRK
ncbi:MAG TPA: RDD family protein, partial [Desulfobacterales bacterium]|nr:RDD family protein [Desulfobacterales bacterium]